ncbi:hypothetical protein [Mycoplasma sp. 'Moose RK']|uniref:hypothetical protein n=1 Tax=Mycoplasma sp. 'Moose RK' TaxID=2780095 RepID=UPI0018C2AB36|nr:hypothetical protein [Mycoplasma sp. 'Moose RK']MBG0730863.1 hypothetical protein [Mycoplasma sp. 'Moose RK']
MKKTKILRFYLSEICDEFQKVQDCYYRLRFAGQTVGIFNSFVDVFSKIQSLKSPVKLWILRDGKFFSVVSFPLSINLDKLDPEQKASFVAKLLVENSDLSIFAGKKKVSQTKFFESVGDIAINKVLKSKKTVKSFPENIDQTELVIVEDEKTIDEIVYSFSQNNDTKIDCSICDQELESEKSSYNCPCHLIELEVSEVKQSSDLNFLLPSSYPKKPSSKSVEIAKIKKKIITEDENYHTEFCDTPIDFKREASCSTCLHNTDCSWCNKYKSYLLEAKNCPKCLETFQVSGFDYEKKIRQLSVYSPNMTYNSPCEACNHNFSCDKCRRLLAFYKEARECPACRQIFALQGVDPDAKIIELSVYPYAESSDLSQKGQIVAYNSPCEACNHNFSCDKCRRLLAFYKEARECPACRQIFALQGVDPDAKIIELSVYPYAESSDLTQKSQIVAYNSSCSSCTHVYFCKLCQKYRKFLQEAQVCPACKYAFAQKNLSIEYLLKIINYQNHPEDFFHPDPLTILSHGRQGQDLPWSTPYLDLGQNFDHLQLSNQPLDQFPSSIPHYTGIIYEAFLSSNFEEQSAIVEDELFNTKRGFGGYNSPGMFAGGQIGIGDLSVDEATRVISATTSKVDEDEEIIIVATEKSSIWGLPSYILWFIVFGLIAVIITVVVMFFVFGAGLI